GVVAAGGLRGPLHHHVTADLVEVVAKPFREGGGGRVEKQSRRLDRVAGNGHKPCLLPVLDPVTEVADSSRFAIEAGLDGTDHAVGADLGPVSEGIGYVGDEGRGLGIDLAALQAESPVDAVRAVAEPAVHYGDRANPVVDAEGLASLGESDPVASERVRRLRVLVRDAPGPVLPGDGKLLFHLL